MRDAWDELVQRFLFIAGDRVEVDLVAVEKKRKARLPSSYERLMETFGPGTFNGFWHVHAPARMGTYGERMKGQVVPKKWKTTVAENGDQLIFASSDNGDQLAFRLRDLKRGEPDIFHLPPRTYPWRPVGKGVLGVVERVAERNLVFERGPARPYFMRARPRRQQTLSFSAPIWPSPRLMDRWVENVTLDGAVKLVDGDGRPEKGWIARTLFVADTLVHAQAVKVGEACRWQVAVNFPVGKLPVAARELLDGGAELGWTSTGMSAAFKASRAKTVTPER
jgi:hypothetical protein